MKRKKRSLNIPKWELPNETEQEHDEDDVEIEHDQETLDKLLPTGSAILNCILADNPFVGYRKGSIVNVVGDSSAGKSLLAFTTFAAIAANPDFDHYRFIYDDVECADSFDIERLFGKKTAKRLEPAYKDSEGNPLSSDTIQDFHFYVKEAIKQKTPFIYILDSFDALDSDEDEKKIEEAHSAKRKGNVVAGSYGMAKAKASSAILRNIKTDLKKTDSLLIIVSQVRDNVGAVMFGPTKTRSGGKALKHYAWNEIWLHLGKKIKSKDRVIGVETHIKIGKNRQTGKQREGVIPIFYDHGIDDIGSCIDFLITEDFFTAKTKAKIQVPQFEFEGSKAKLIEHIESNNLEHELHAMVGQCWNQIEDSLKLNRKRRFE